VKNIRVSILTIYINELDLEDPKENSAVQRTWINKEDAGIKFVETKKDLKLPKIDNVKFNIVNNNQVEPVKDKPITYRISDINKYILKPFNLRGN
jgi:hypothetical protein